MFRSNFDSRGFIKDDDRLIITGDLESSDAGSPVSRHVAVAQGDAFASGRADGDRNWQMDNTFETPGFMPGEALALGTETYVLQGPPRFVTVTWSEVITLERWRPA